jgi:kynurenine formamidase
MEQISSKKIIDLTHELNEHNPTWDGSCGFTVQTLLNYNECDGIAQFKIQSAHLHQLGVGTHIDAPLHCFAESPSVAALPLKQLIATTFVISVADKVVSNHEYQISVDDIVLFEHEHGVIKQDTLVILHTGWDHRWPDSQAYRNRNAQGSMVFPTLALDAAEFLLERNVVGIAIDTLSPDLPESDFPVHRLLLGQNKYIIENLHNAPLLPPKGATVIALPVKINATEAPVRVIALVD